MKYGGTPGGFVRFLAYLMESGIGECPPDKSLDRIDNERGYERDNIRWADAKTQANNQRRRAA